MRQAEKLEKYIHDLKKADETCTAPEKAEKRFDKKDIKRRKKYSKI